jgi:hypothetical protein
MWLRVCVCGWLRCPTRTAAPRPLPRPGCTYERMPVAGAHRSTLPLLLLLLLRLRLYRCSAAAVMAAPPPPPPLPLPLPPAAPQGLQGHDDENWPVHLMGPNQTSTPALVRRYAALGKMQPGIRRYNSASPLLAGPPSFPPLHPSTDAQ